jgi:1,4-alpha-glucan branching enzyme
MTERRRAASASIPPALEPAAAQALASATAADPFALLGPHPIANGGVVVRTFLPGAERVELLAADDGRPLAQMAPQQVGGLFAATLEQACRYRLRIHWPGALQETEDPYAFGPLLGELDLHLFAEGRHQQLGQVFGARCTEVDGIKGVRFAVWAPNARRVSVVGNFNHWDGRRHPMRKRLEAGVWELFVPRIGPGERYKYEILGPHGLLPQKADPLALQTESPPQTASVVADPAPFDWHDQAWLEQRAARHDPQAPISIYELHAGSWRRAGGRAPDWDQLADGLLPHVQQLGFSHIELLPIMAHPFGGSWGYQPLGLFAPQAEFGEPAAFARFVDRCHQAGIGVLLDWVPAHFPTDAHGMAHFDGTALYEHADPREGYHQDWNTLIYNMGRHEVRGFLIASALHWLEHFHLDGLRVDAVASMLYRDYSRAEGEWVPNRFGGRENLESIQFLRQLNQTVRERCPGAMMIAEESTAWPGVTRPVEHDGLGFHYKWNMGWMHDTLQYMAKEPIHRRWEHQQMTFGLVYAFSEQFVLPLSHDEVVHGKGSLIGRMPGDPWQRFANLRAYYGFMWGHPGKKLLFMGGEFAQEREWNHDRELDWGLLADPFHRGVQTLVGDLNALYRAQPALHASDCDGHGFRWLVEDDRDNSVFAFCRRHGDAPPLLVIGNFTPVPRHGYRIGAPLSGNWVEVMNTDAPVYGGSGLGNLGRVVASGTPSHGQPHSIVLTVPPLATLMLVWRDAGEPGGDGRGHGSNC